MIVSESKSYPMVNISLRRRARQFSTLVRHSVVTPREGQTHRPTLATDGETAITFIGHSSFFLQLGGRNFIVDPNFAKWLFILKRLRRPGLRIKDLPPIDAVLVTHAHFDHLHRPSLRAIARATRRRTGHAPSIIVAEHMCDLVSDLGFSRVTELRWWESLKLGGIEITHTPASHWGARVLRDMHRGFGGYVFRSEDCSIYHAGDTAYFNGFHEIGKRLAPEIALMPIGAYHPPSFRNVHMNPADALRGFMDLGAEYVIPMHYGTFKLSHEPMDEPLRFLATEAKRLKIEDRVIVLEEGITKLFTRDETPQTAE
jgi:L-ascorbate metabolism protein UlaG (beta-lactamase superfamily)